jgi:glycosyltransferase involved in cell wall biosynthesis
MADETLPRMTGGSRIFYVVDNYSGSTWYRCRVPGLELALHGHEVRLKPDIPPEDLEWCDVLVINRLGQPHVLEAVEAANRAGKMTVLEIDDDYWCINPTNPAYEYWSTPGELEGLTTVVRACRRVTVSTEPLKRVLERFHSDVRVLPNMIPDPYWPTEAKPPNMTDELVIGWAGSPTHYEDLADVSRVLPQILDQYPKVEVWFGGVYPGHFPEHERLRYLNAVDVEVYAHMLYDFDIGIAPLLDNRFNVAKSDLKLLEYSTIGLSVVVSRVIPYEKSVKPGETALFASNPKDWLRNLRRLIEDPPLRAQLGANARAWAETRLMSRNYQLWEKAYGIQPARPVEP